MPNEEQVREAIDTAITSGDLASLKQWFAVAPAVRDRMSPFRTWLFDVAYTPHIHIAEYLLSIGVDINFCSTPDRTTALHIAISKTQWGMFRWLIVNSADTNLGRPIISAINIRNRHPDELALQYVQYLVENGCDVNQLFVFMGDNDHLFTALDWASEDSLIGKYLRNHGAKTAAELGHAKPKPAAEEKSGSTAPSTNSEAVVAYFTEHFGAVNEQSLMEIVPSEPAIAVHVVPPTGDRKHLTLFTTGMSSLAMTVGPDAEEYRFGELFIELPGDWKYRELGDPAWGWPIHRLRSLGKLPHQTGDWLRPVTIVDNEDPPRPLAPNVKFTALLLMAERVVAGPDGQVIQLYRVTPLYPEERDLERREGLPALLRAFDKHDVPFIVDLHRKNVATDKKA